jgi:hypothetical protein
MLSRLLAAAVAIERATPDFATGIAATTLSAE